MEAKALAQALPEFIPENLTKLYFVRCSLTAPVLEAILEGLRRTPGLKTIVIAKNQWSDQMINNFAARFVSSPGIKKIKKLAIKDTGHIHLSPACCTALTHELNKQSQTLDYLTKLTLSGLTFSRKAMSDLSQVVAKIYNLKYLDLSHNQIASNDISSFLDHIT